MILVRVLSVEELSRCREDSKTKYLSFLQGFPGEVWDEHALRLVVTDRTLRVRAGISHRGWDLRSRARSCDNP